MNKSNKTNYKTPGGKIDGALAKKMIEDLKAKKSKLKFDDCIWAQFDKDKLGKICSDSTVTQVKIFIGVFPDDSTPDKKDAPVIIMQVRKNDTMSLKPVYEYSTGDTLCPPPNDSSCGPIE